MSELTKVGVPLTDFKKAMKWFAENPAPDYIRITSEKNEMRGTYFKSQGGHPTAGNNLLTEEEISKQNAANLEKKKKKPLTKKEA